MPKEREIGIYFKVSQKELEIMRQKMAQLGTANQSAYIRKMVIDGYVVKLDWREFRDMLSLLRRTAANVNQIALRCNATSNLYEADVIDLKSKYDLLAEQMKKVVTQAASLKGL